MCAKAPATCALGRRSAAAPSSAWGDSNLYLRRRGDTLRLHVEHRAAASPADLFLALPSAGRPLALEILPEPAGEAVPIPARQQRVYDVLAAAAQPLALTDLRQACRIRTSTLCAILAALAAEGAVRKTPDGYTVVR